MAPLLIVALDAANFMLALLLVTLGLVILFGLMNVINMAHGEMFLLGAYAVVLVERHGGGFWLALTLAPLALAGLAGAVMAPLMSVDPQMGVGFLIPAFLSILVGGSGSLLGTLLGTTLIAGAGTVVSSIWTQITAQIVVFALAIVVIRLFPQGLAGGSQAR